ncbi:MAG: YfiR family protein [Breznakibacter sp.]|nr:YfiR family protein [Breznakibacter sp.]
MKRLLLLLAILFTGVLAHSQEVKYKASFTLNFIRYIGWPEEQTKGEFVIGVLKNKPLAKLLTEQSTGKKFGFQDIVIKEFATPAEVTKCQVLYVGSSVSLSKYGAELIQNCGGKQFLLIAESEGATDKGAIINFVLVNDVLKFELSAANASKMGLTYSSKLSTMSSAINK